MATLRPAIYIAGIHDPRLSGDLVQLESEETLSAPARCRATFTNIAKNSDGRPDFTYFDLDNFNFGSELSIFVGVPPNTQYRLFYGRINLIEAQYPENRRPEIAIEAEDAFQQLRIKQRTRIFEQMNDEEIIRQIASEYEFTHEISLDSPLHHRVAQLNQSDLSFLQERVRSAGGVMWMEPNKLIVKNEIEALTNPQELEYGAALKQFVVQGDLRNQATSVGISGWDIRSKTPIRHSATDTALVSATMGKTGGRALEEAFGQRLQILLRDMPDSNEEAEHLAATYYRENAGRFVTGTGMTEHLPALHVGCIVNIRGVGKLFEGHYTVTKVRHCFDTKDGLRTEFNVRRAWIGEIKETRKVRKNVDKQKQKKRKAAGK